MFHCIRHCQLEADREEEGERERKGRRKRRERTRSRQGGGEEGAGKEKFWTASQGIPRRKWIPRRRLFFPSREHTLSKVLWPSLFASNSLTSITLLWALRFSLFSFIFHREHRLVLFTSNSFTSFLISDCAFYWLWPLLVPILTLSSLYALYNLHFGHRTSLPQGVFCFFFFLLFA